MDREDLRDEGAGRFVRAVRALALPLSAAALAALAVAWWPAAGESRWPATVTLTLLALVLSRLGRFALRSDLRGGIDILTRELERVGHGELDRAIGADVPDEIERLAQGAERMRRELRESQVSRDLLEESEAKLRRSIGNWHATFDSILDPVLVVDAGGRVQRANQAASSLLRAPLDRTTGVWLGEATSEEPFRTALALVAEIATHREGGLARVVSAAERSWEVRVEPLRSLSSVEGAVVVMRDISELEELSRRVAAHDRLAELGAFVSGIAHEVRNPLFGLAANLEAWEAEGGEERFAPYRERAKREIERLNRLMHDLLEYGRPTPLDRARCEIADVLNSAASECQYQAKARGIGILVQIADPFPPGWVDRARLTQAVVNLLENAISFSPEGLEVVVAATLPAVRPHTFEITVLDRGPGFSVDDLERALEPFFTRRRGGTGLGLSIVRRVVEEHGGKLLLTNREGGGAEVIASLPLPAEAAA